MIKCTKNKAFLIFEKDFGNDRVKFNLGTGESFNKFDRKVKSLQPFFANYTIDNIIWDVNEYKLLIRQVRRNNRRLRNVGSLLNELHQFAAHESWILRGMTPSPSWKHLKPVNEYNKIAVKLFSEYARNSSETIRLIMENDNEFSIKIIESINSIVEEIDETILQAVFGDTWCFSKFIALVKDFEMKPTALLRHLQEYYRAEGISAYQVINQLNDYNRMAKAMTPKYTKYPKYLLSMHNIVQKNYRAFRERYDELEFQRVVDNELAHTGISYSIVVPEAPKDVQREGAAMNNCVASYVRSILKGQCQIVFMRKNKELDKSYVTVEIRDGRIVQAKASCNQSISEEDYKFLETYAKIKSLSIDKRL